MPDSRNSTIDVIEQGGRYSTRIAYRKDGSVHRFHTPGTFGSPDEAVEAGMENLADTAFSLTLLNTGFRHAVVMLCVGTMLVMTRHYFPDVEAAIRPVWALFAVAVFAGLALCARVALREKRDSVRTATVTFPKRVSE